MKVWHYAREYKDTPRDVIEFELWSKKPDGFDSDFTHPMNLIDVSELEDKYIIKKIFRFEKNFQESDVRIAIHQR